METYIDNLLNESWFQLIMKSEGGYNPREPASVGGKSYAGVTQKTYDEWRNKRCQITDAPKDVKDLAGTVIGSEWEKASPLKVPKLYNVRLDVITAFYKDYFKKAYIELLPECLRYIHADFFVNSMYNSNKIIQKMCGFEGKDVDGILGPDSLKAMDELKLKLQKDVEENSTADDDLIMEFHNFKVEHYESIKDKNPELYYDNIKGWIKRSQHILSELEEYFVDENPTVSAVYEDETHEGLFDDETTTKEFDKDVLIPEVTESVMNSLMKELPEIIEKVLESYKKDK